MYHNVNSKQKLRYLLVLLILVISFFMLRPPIVHADGSDNNGSEAEESEGDDDDDGSDDDNNEEGEDEGGEVYTLVLETSLRNGDLYDSLRLDWIPMLKSLATGTVPGDKFTWSFEDTPLYIDGRDKLQIEQKFASCMESDIVDPECIASAVFEYPVGFYDLGKLAYTSETREIKDEDENTFYRCALTSISVKSWRSPYGAICPRKDALEYYNKCQKQIKAIVSKIKQARQSGNPLTDEQKLKWVHDWLINSASYDSKGLEAEEDADEEVALAKYRYLYNEYGPIIDGKTAAQGYSQAFKAIVDELARQNSIKVECEIADTGDHFWNRVKLNGKWYHIDITLDENYKDDYFGKEISTTYFLVSDYALKNHPGGGEDGYCSLTVGDEPATDRKYEGKKWPRYKKDLSEYTVALKYPSKTYVYNGKQIIPQVVVKYGKNTVPEKAYQVIRTDKLNVGIAKIKIIPSEKCNALEGSVKGPDFKIIEGSKKDPKKFSGTAKSTKKYKLENGKSACPFDKEFKPFDTAYKYSSKSTTIKKDQSLTLKNGTDYTVKYTGNKKPGLATAIITLKGNYSGKITVKYQIDKIKISGSAKSTKNYKLGKAKSIRPFDKTFKPFAATYKYTKQPELAKVLKKSLTLKKGTDYTVTYKNNKKKGWATATIILKGNYSGKIIIKYEIVK